MHLPVLASLYILGLNSVATGMPNQAASVVRMELIPPEHEALSRRQTPDLSSDRTPGSPSSIHLIPQSGSLWNYELQYACLRAGDVFQNARKQIQDQTYLYDVMPRTWSYPRSISGPQGVEIQITRLKAFRFVDLLETLDVMEQYADSDEFSRLEVVQIRSKSASALTASVKIVYQAGQA